MKRYQNLFLALDEIAKRTNVLNFIEIGTYNGVRACQLLNYWLKSNQSRVASYVGFDLWELLTPAMRKQERSKSNLPPRQSDVSARIKTTGAHYKLIKGNTHETLPRFVKAEPRGQADHWSLIYQDGGHSLETVESDWRWASQLVSPNTIYLFDDYYLNCDEFGCGPLIRRLSEAGMHNIELLDPVDHYDSSQLDIRMVKVTKKG